jgi:hypothetical protein
MYVAVIVIFNNGEFMHKQHVLLVSVCNCWLVEHFPY